MILEFLPYRACEAILPTLISVRAFLPCIGSRTPTFRVVLQVLYGMWLASPKWQRSCDVLQAAANAKENLKMSKLNLYISECYADSGPAFKRFSHGYKGR